MSSDNQSFPLLQPLRVLLVEDNPLDADLIVHELRRSGFDPLWQRVETESAYLAQLETAPDIVLADYALPQFSAARALQLLQERRSEIPFLVVSGTIGEEAAVTMMKHGATDYVLKDRVARLGSVVVRALQGNRTIAYFSMEIALESAMPTYSGGLGVLAGDTLRSAADLRVPAVAVTMLYRSGYFRQRFDANGWQIADPVDWQLESFLTEMRARTTVTIEGRTVHLRCWKYGVKGIAGYSVPVYLLDSNLPENTEWDRKVTDVLYGGDSYYRLCQEVVLGIGGVRMLRALGYDTIERFHMNEGHASFLTFELLREQARAAGKAQIDLTDVAAVRKTCIFTTHTPVPAGHDQFPLRDVSRVLGYREDFSDLFQDETAARVFGRRQRQAGVEPRPVLDAQGMLNMTHLGLNLSRYVNGVAKKHGEVSRLMFTGYQIDAITNGVHAGTWTAPPFQDLFDRHIPDWRQDNFSLRHAESIPRSEVWDAHMRAKVALLGKVRETDGVAMDDDVLTIGFARRAATYKRADLLFTDVDRLRSIATQAGGLQVIYAGKAHPSDDEGKLLLQRILQLKQVLAPDIRIAFLANYDMDLAKLITGGVDLWLNTPQPPLEASGTSGMKAAVNGIPSFSILDGWWIEGAVKNITGWAIGTPPSDQDPASRRADDARSLYDTLEHEIVPVFCRDRNGFVDIMRHVIALNASYFNTHRMLQQYVLRAYFH
jgi:starch phosphorylase